ncbi:BON domain-containing protein [Magnetofaba australis]|nr:BON domain-containing protein [Magnetofaba australis]
MKRTRPWSMGMGIALALGLSGCAPLLLGGGAAVTGAAAERRGAMSVVDDAWIDAKLNTLFVRSESVKWGNVSFRVYRGKVLLMGTAETEAEVSEAVRLAQSVTGVKHVYNELKVQYVSAKDIAHDAWISAQVKARIFGDEHVRGLDIHVDTVNQVVYLTGLADSQAERQRAERLASITPGVKEVVSYIEVVPSDYPVSPTMPEQNPEPDTVSSDVL